MIDGGPTPKGLWCGASGLGLGLEWDVGQADNIREVYETRRTLVAVVSKLLVLWVGIHEKSGSTGFKSLIFIIN